MHTLLCDFSVIFFCLGSCKSTPRLSYYIWWSDEVGALTEVERDSGVVVRLAVSDEVDLVLPLLLLQAVFGATVVTHAAAAQDEDDRPNHPKPCQTQTATSDSFSNKSKKKKKKQQQGINSVLCRGQGRECTS